jgi:uncharacterized membrane protein YtjA (UPF0391 family)
MLRLALLFFVIALVSAVLGFGALPHYAWEGGKLLCIVFLILAVVSFLAHAFRRRSFWE